MTTVHKWSGHKARALREALRMGVRGFAAHLGVSERTVTKWEAGRAEVCPRPENQQALDTVLRRASDEVRARFEAAAYMDAGSEPEIVTDTPRRTDNGSFKTGEELVLMAARESIRHGRRYGKSNVYSTDLEQLEADVRELAVDFMSARPVPVVLRARAHRDEAFELLDNGQWPQQTRQLFFLAGQLCGLLAVASGDFFGRYDAAAAQCRTAWLCAEMADRHELRSWVRALQSGVAFWAGRWAKAAALARAAREYSHTASSATRATALEARALARLGDDSGARHAVAVSESARELPADEDAVGVIGFSEANRVRCAGTAYLWLGDYREARRHLETALDSFERSDPDAYVHVSVTRMDLAKAHLLAGDADDAEVALRPVLTAVPERRLAGVARRANDLRVLLTRPEFRGSRSAHTLATEIDHFRVDMATLAVDEG